jgi:anti-sigma regulatory factor (Ser/Thr protein kinase)
VPSLRLTPDSPDAGRDARRFVRDALSAHLPADDVADAELIATELVANAVRHAGTPIELRVEGSAGQLRIEVSDEATGAAPRPAPPVPMAESGRGLQILSALSSSWGFEVGEVAKTVWSEMKRGRRPPRS